jgi:hypothetical protein
MSVCVCVCVCVRMTYFGGKNISSQLEYHIKLNIALLYIVLAGFNRIPRELNVCIV